MHYLFLGMNQLCKYKDNIDYTTANLIYDGINYIFYDTNEERGYETPHSHIEADAGKRHHDNPCDEIIQSSAADFLQSLYEYWLPARNPSVKLVE